MCCTTIGMAGSCVWRLWQKECGTSAFGFRSAKAYCEGAHSRDATGASGGGVPGGEGGGGEGGDAGVGGAPGGKGGEGGEGGGGGTGGRELSHQPTPTPPPIRTRRPRKAQHCIHAKAAGGGAAQQPSRHRRHCALSIGKGLVSTRVFHLFQFAELGAYGLRRRQQA
jgi:hypothetical protein